MAQASNIPNTASRLFQALPTGAALVDDRGNILEGNAAFWETVGADADQPATFSVIFGMECDPPALNGTTVTFAERHYSLATQQLDDGNAICQLQEVTDWVIGQAEAQKSSNRDGLTGLENRKAFLPEVDRTLKVAGATALIMIDLDHFKNVNDTLGHPVGDALLRKVSKRLLAALRKGDRAARLGGDEFAVLQSNAEQPHGGETLAKRLVELLSRPYVIEGHMIDISASAGVALGNEAIGSATLMKQADIALYRAKDAGRAQYCFFEQSMDAEMQKRRALETDLRRALAFRQFELYYQPQLDLESQQVTGMEALIRWHHPELGLISPATFIPLAEEMGLIIPIGEWVIRQACDHAANWNSRMSVSVNVSAKQLASGKLVKTVAGALANSGLQPDQLEIEITESVLMSDITGCVATLRSLRELGIRISMDDFGTGYSSLSYLQSFPFHTIKIDQSFIQSMDVEKSDGIIRAITAIGKHLGMTTIAEGVETSAQLSQVTSSGCSSAQGYLFSRPVPAGEVAGMLDRLARKPVGADDISSKDLAPAIAESVKTDLYQLVYCSQNAIMGVNEEVREAIDQILAASQKNNAAAGVTGALMFTNGLFAQVLEGPLAAVEAVFERIQLDERHANVQLLSFLPTNARQFSNWAMAFVGGAEADLANFGHYGQTSGFDYSKVDGSQIISELRAMLVDEERLSQRAAA